MICPDGCQFDVRIYPFENSRYACSYIAILMHPSIFYLVCAMEHSQHRHSIRTLEADIIGRKRRIHYSRKWPLAILSPLVEPEFHDDILMTKIIPQSKSSIHVISNAGSRFKKYLSSLGRRTCLIPLSGSNLRDYAICRGTFRRSPTVSDQGAGANVSNILSSGD